ncbi:MAG TPA: outer membrane beta-barrel protein [Steroidobacteraceae bacterium]|nr:outer membrane beta-barrel protein [Steroidobacteraceae bacterium]
MKKRNPLRLAACAIALSACAAAPALAKDSGFYVGADIGRTTFDVDASTVQIFPVSTGVNVDDSDIGFSFNFGYRINRYLGVELSFTELGNFQTQEYGSVNIQVPGATPSIRPAFGTAIYKIGGDGYGLSVAGSLPIKKFELFGRLGAMYAKTTGNLALFTASADSTNVCAANCTWALRPAGLGSVSDNTTEFVYTIGAGYTFGEDLFFKLEWSRLPDLGDEDEIGDEFDVDSVSLGFEYRF